MRVGILTSFGFEHAPCSPGLKKHMKLGFAFLIVLSYDASFHQCNIEGKAEADLGETFNRKERKEKRGRMHF